MKSKRRAIEDIIEDIGEFRRRNALHRGEF